MNCYFVEWNILKYISFETQSPLIKHKQVIIKKNKNKNKTNTNTNTNKHKQTQTIKTNINDQTIINE